MKPIVGGGPKKVLYTLSTIKRIGLKHSAKALKAKNTCKACGLGMGGQLGGMTNESGEFPSVCNKSIQAQSTDIQSPIPTEIFNHPLNELRELSPKELEHIGRLSTPLFKTAESNRYYQADWDWALRYIAEKMMATKPDRSFFYSSGRSSNEAGFLLQLLARLYGTNNVNNCSYYCHQATSVGLGSTIGTGTATVELEDLSGCDLVFVIGANPASNHPRFIHQLKKCRDRGGHVIVINPAKEPGLVKFAVPKSMHSMIVGGTDIASLYLQPNIGSDIALFKGIAKSILDNGKEDRSFIKNYCEHAETFIEDINNTSWTEIEKHCCVSRDQIELAATFYSNSKNTIFAWGMGMTHHQFGSENVEYIANLALLRGMVGQRYRGLLPLRGHSNVQGIGTIGVKPVLAEDVFRNIEKHFDTTLPRKQGLDTFHALKAAQEGNMDFVMMVGGNLYSASPQSQWTAAALNKIAFKCYLTTTLNQSHLYGVDEGEALILPVKARDEESQPTTQESMFNYVRLSEGGIDRIDNIKSEVDILASIGHFLFNEHSSQKDNQQSTVQFKQLANHNTLREAIAKTIPGMEALEDIGVAKKEFHLRNRLMHTPEFNTQSQKAPFITHPIPVANKNKKEYPFLLASIRSEGQFNSIIYEEYDTYRHHAKRDALLISEDDMQTLNLKQGDKVSIESAYGRLDSLTIQRFDLPKGNLLAYYPEANVLTEHKLDPRSKTPNFKSVAVNITSI